MDDNPPVSLALDSPLTEGAKAVGADAHIGPLGEISRPLRTRKHTSHPPGWLACFIPLSFSKPAISTGFAVCAYPNHSTCFSFPRSLKISVN